MSKSKSDAPVKRQPLPGQKDFLSPAEAIELIRTPVSEPPSAKAPWPNVLSFPLGDLPVEGYVSRHVDVRLTPGQAVSLKRLLAGLDAAHERLESGKPVASLAGAVQWVLERIAPPA